MGLKLCLSQLFLLVFFVYIKCVLTLGSDHTAGKEIIKEENIKTSTVHIGLDSSVNVYKDNKKSDTLIEIPIDKPSNGRPMVQLQNQGSALKKGTSQLVLEGGGIIDLTSTTAQPNSSLLDIEVVDDNTNHSRGSKPRKGVHHPGSSVVPRKGVDPLGAFNFNQSSAVLTNPTNDSASSVSDKKTPLNKTEPLKENPNQKQVNEQSTPKAPHPKKPVVVTDIEDVDDFEKYPIIQTSTTGEDYIIIGIVIVLGIWCSIFGALIFYRRAGEYWDRRHYRRMDFLVEGMYND